jgi:hypothetical protein
MSDPVANPRKVFIAEKHAKLETIQTDLKKLKKDMHETRAKGDKVAAKNLHTLFVAKREERLSTRKTRFIPA